MLTVEFVRASSASAVKMYLETLKASSAQLNNLWLGVARSVVDLTFGPRGSLVFFKSF